METGSERVSVVEGQRPSISIIIPTYNPGQELDACLASLFAQDASADTEIIVVDDGSSHPIEIDPDSKQLRLLRLPRNLGRAAARNAGAGATNAALLLFLDSDCVPDSPHWVQAHVNALAAGAIAASGPLHGEIPGFRDRYQREASARRRAQHAEGNEYAGTTANLSVRADVFAQAGGFDEAYMGYGFEDRDLLLRLAALGRIAWIDAPVRHMDVLRLAGIRAKFVDAGGMPAKLFQARHPAAYARLGHARLDAGLHPLLRPLAPLAGALAHGTAWLGDAAIARGLMPYALGRHWVKATAAMAFLAGTARR
jgi:glycosyltransferase involved in cell wall biosynthesis